MTGMALIPDVMKESIASSTEPLVMESLKLYEIHSMAKEDVRYVLGNLRTPAPTSSPWLGGKGIPYTTIIDTTPVKNYKRFRKNQVSSTKWGQ